MTHEEIIKVVQAHKNGSKVEFQDKFYPHTVWNEQDSPTWNFNNFDYRVKEESKDE